MIKQNNKAKERNQLQGPHLRHAHTECIGVDHACEHLTNPLFWNKL